jgi:glutamate formiminotransferase/formiminotetrahydrofolate cyclodeaminase
MVANLSAHKPGWDDRWKEFSDWAEKGQKFKEDLLFLVDEDTNSFNKIIDAVRLPNNNKQEKEDRKIAIENATKYATEIPFKVMQTALDSLSVMKKMIEIGNQNSLSDAAVGALCAKTAIAGAFLNVRINAKDLNDKQFAQDIIERAKLVYDEGTRIENEIMKTVNQII